MKNIVMIILRKQEKLKIKKSIRLELNRIKYINFIQFGKFPPFFNFTEIESEKIIFISESNKLFILFKYKNILALNKISFVLNIFLYVKK